MPPPPRVPSQSLPPPPPTKGTTRHGSAESLTSPGPPPPARRNSQVQHSPVFSDAPYNPYNPTHHLHNTTWHNIIYDFKQVSPASPPRPTVSHGRTRSSPVSLADTLAAAPTSPEGSGGGGGGRKSPRYETPPGTPPPPYVPGSVELVAPGWVPNVITWLGAG